MVRSKKSTSKILWFVLASILAASASAHPETDTAQGIEAPAACTLTLEERLPVDAIYSIRGTYFDDGHHGSFLEIPKCDLALFPKIDGSAAEAIFQYHAAFEKKCGGQLMGDHISGVFTGKFVRGEVRLDPILHDGQSSMTVNLFVVTAIDSKDLDVSSIKCAS